MSRVPPVPADFGTLTPHLTVRDAAAAIDFYARAFGARERFRQLAPGSARILHAQLQLGDSVLMLNDEFPEHGAHAPGRQGSAVTLHLYVPDVDATWAAAVRAGCRVRAPLTDTFWGDRYGLLADPFGHAWSLASRREELSPAQLDARTRASWPLPAPADPTPRGA